jgi:GH15 family glucan-1,4-alpha-glucosidase
MAGYRASLRIRNGNRAWKQSQLGSYGFMLDCLFDFLEQGGDLDAVDRDLLQRAAEFTSEHWQEPDSGSSELDAQEHCVSSKVMSWVVLDRAIKIIEQHHKSVAPRHWQKARAQIHAEVMERGWSEKMHAFREHYDADSVNAVALVIPVMSFLPATHPRVAATVERIEAVLTIDGQVYRFVPRLSPAASDLPLGTFKGAFTPCTFWLATTYARMGKLDRAAQLLDRVEAVAGPLGFFSEELDPRTWTLLGNTPLLFAHAEYVRAVRAIEDQRSASRGNSAVAASHVL